jgi:sterol desaturase/sphingolipid hydroxylase (fatty acid hydroxylase superfamily)
MADATAEEARGGDGRGRPQQTWLWHPPLPLEGVPIFVWPPRPLAALKYLLSLTFLGSIVLPFGALAVFVWTTLQPPLADCADLRIGWVLLVYGRNLALMLLVAGGLHLYFFTFKRQGAAEKFDPRGMARNNRRYFTGDQVRDNIFWTCASGVTTWTAYEVLILWAYANDWVPYYIDWTRHPVWFLATFLAIPFWASLHFYFVHRLLHWKPLYRLAHALHHRNVNIGPWSGLSMHPVEHLIYLSSVLIHLAVASHPIHVLFHNYWNTLGAATSHTGFQSLLFKGKPILMLGSFHHQLHHRYYNCNYGNPFMPWDKWFGSDNDGTPEALARMRARQGGGAKAAA